MMAHGCMRLRVPILQPSHAPVCVHAHSAGCLSGPRWYMFDRKLLLTCAGVSFGWGPWHLNRGGALSERQLSPFACPLVPVPAMSD